MRVYTGQWFRQVPQRMQCRVWRSWESARIFERPLSSMIKWTSRGPSFSPALRGEVIILTYVEISCPVADPVSKRSNGGTSSNLSITFSRPMTAICTGGTVVHVLPLPSFSIKTSVPVSATARLTPLRPTWAS